MGWGLQGQGRVDVGAMLRGGETSSSRDGNVGELVTQPRGRPLKMAHFVSHGDWPRMAA